MALMLSSLWTLMIRMIPRMEMSQRWTGLKLLAPWDCSPRLAMMVLVTLVKHTLHPQSQAGPTLWSAKLSSRPKMERYPLPAVRLVMVRSRYVRWWLLPNLFFKYWSVYALIIDSFLLSLSTGSHGQLHFAQVGGAYLDEQVSQPGYSICAYPREELSQLWR